MAAPLKALCLLTPLWLGCASGAAAPCAEEGPGDGRCSVAHPERDKIQLHPPGQLDAARGAKAPRHHHAHHHKQHDFKDAARWARTFDAPERDLWQRPEVVIAALAPEGEPAPRRIIDVGAGTGYFTARIARAFPDAIVTAADVERSLLAWISTRKADSGLQNVRTHLSSPGGLDWPGTAPRVDLVFLCNVYHHIEDREAYFRDVLGAMTAGGRLVVVDFRPESPRGPPAEHKLPDTVVIDELARAGWVLVSREDTLPDQYLLRFAPGSDGG